MVSSKKQLLALSPLNCLPILFADTASLHLYCGLQALVCLPRHHKQELSTSNFLQCPGTEELPLSHCRKGVLLQLQNSNASTHKYQLLAMPYHNSASPEVLPGKGTRSFNNLLVSFTAEPYPQPPDIEQFCTSEIDWSLSGPHSNEQSHPGY